MNPTSFDLRFRLGGIPVTIQPWFWLTALLLGAQLTGPRIIFWVGLVFISVLIHELGHALAFRFYGMPSSITLRAFGGSTLPTRNVARWPTVVVTLAGPAAGFALAAIAFVIQRVVFIPSAMLGWTLASMVAINLFWSAVNLMPVPPLDGGHVLLSVAGPRRRREAMVVGIVVGGLLAIYAFTLGQPYLALMLGFMVWQNVQTVRAVAA